MGHGLEIASLMPRKMTERRLLGKQSRVALSNLWAMVIRQAGSSDLIAIPNAQWKVEPINTGFSANLSLAPGWTDDLNPMNPVQ